MTLAGGCASAFVRPFAGSDDARPKRLPRDRAEPLATETRACDPCGQPVISASTASTSPFDRPVEVAEAIRRVLAADRTNERPSSQCGKPHEHRSGAS